MNNKWLWMLSILASCKNNINFVENPNIWENSDWSILNIPQKCECLFYYTYYYTLLNINYYFNSKKWFWKSDYTKK